MTQKQLIIEYIKENGSILPAKCYGKVYKGEMLGSETSKRCRELRKAGVLKSVPEGKFERFYLVSKYTYQSLDRHEVHVITGPGTSYTAEEFLKKYPSKKEVETKQTLFKQNDYYSLQ